MSQPWRGIFPIIATPFTKGYELDEASLRKTVHFCIEAGAHGLVGPANASEFATLSDDERKRWIEIVVGEAGGKVPVVASTTSAHAVPAVALSRHAQHIGADGITAMPPHILHPDEAGCYEYYEAISSAVDVPVCIQNHIGPVGTPMTTELMARMCHELPGVEYIKEETPPEPRQISAAIMAAGDACKGVFGGQGGLYLVDEYGRGAAGNMPGCHITDALVAVWGLLEARQETEARIMLSQLLPLMSYERLHGVGVYKQTLHRRGIVATPLCRAAGRELDEKHTAELDAIQANIGPLMGL
jgi:4-hydroxy-tetrahydrodipicolinate synthase